jgi:hypothetical protein
MSMPGDSPHSPSAAVSSPPPPPPRFEKKYPELFRGFAERLETSEYDWHSTLLCNCMLVQAVKM